MSRLLVLCLALNAEGRVSEVSCIELTENSEQLDALDMDRINQNTLDLEKAEDRKGYPPEEKPRANVVVRPLRNVNQLNEQIRICIIDSHLHKTVTMVSNKTFKCSRIFPIQSGKYYKIGR